VPGSDLETLLQRAKTGHKPAFDHLHRALEDKVRSFFRRLVGYSDSENDSIQEAFVALYMNLERIQSAQHLLPFLFRVLRQRCYDTWRSKKRVERLSLEFSASAQAPAAGRLPDEQSHWALLLVRVQHEIDRLPENQRQTLILHFEEGLTYEQVALAMGVDLGTVKSRIYYGRKKLRRELGPELLETLESPIQKESYNE